MKSAFSENLGTCFVKYTNLASTGEYTRKGVAVSIGNRIVHYDFYSGSSVSTQIADLSGDYEIDRRFVIDLIRLGRIGYVLWMAFL